MKSISYPQGTLTPLNQQEMRDITAGDVILESTIWLLGAIWGSYRRVTDDESGRCGEDETYSRRHGVCT
ncbi:hypothetical protein [Natronogracilivirga saccharolytica]|uniref:Uncharacterized protein n=1 Tax=Natronogracilivirga saccharolytica TaxID=2812953 RepID=A0A8J7UXG0_9BACT|nr:hypothetical protein [Natronogracilivirga saccharolytica]MBP3193284.1 hypothetical protein [Natronogracilivirga saccharolytica]